MKKKITIRPESSNIIPSYEVKRRKKHWDYKHRYFTYNDNDCETHPRRVRDIGSWITTSQRLIEHSYFSPYNHRFRLEDDEPFLSCSLYYMKTWSTYTFSTHTLLRTGDPWDTPSQEIDTGGRHRWNASGSPCIALIHYAAEQKRSAEPTQ